MIKKLVKSLVTLSLVACMVLAPAANASASTAASRLATAIAKADAKGYDSRGMFLYDKTTEKTTSTSTLSTAATSTKTETTNSNACAVQSMTSSTVGYVDTVHRYIVVRETTKTKNYTKGSKTVKITKVVKRWFYTCPDLMLPKCPNKLVEAFNYLGFDLKFDSTVSYAGYFNASNGTITLKSMRGAIYHEMGHFLGFVSGNYDRSDEFKAIHAHDIKLVGTYYLPAFSDPSDYFAEAFREYCTDRENLKAERPQTYNAIVEALSKVTSDRLTTYKNVFGSRWA